MDNQSNDKKIPHKTHGGYWGHLWRRLIHVTMIAIPILYYTVVVPFLLDNHASEHKVLLGILLIALVFEAIRLWKGFIFFGHREHERNQISSFTWGISSIVIVLLFIPHSGHHEIAYALPIIGGCALGDPWIGELRTYHVNHFITVISATILIALLWLICSVLFHIPWWYALIGAPLAVIGEYTKLRWIDDNATMMLLPLIAIIAIHYL